MALDMNRLKERQAQTAKGTGDRYKFVEGPNRVRIFKFEHKVTKADVKAGHYIEAKLGQVVEEVDRPVTIHFGVGAEGRPVESCPSLVDRYTKLANSRSEEDIKRAKDIAPQTRYAINIVDTAERPYKMRHTLLPKTVYNKILGILKDEDYGEAILGCKGRDLTVTYDPNARGSDKYGVKVRDEAKCQPVPDDVMASVKDFFSDGGYAALGILPSPDAKKEDEEEETKEEDEDVAPPAKPAKTAEKKAETKKDDDDDGLEGGTPAAKPAKSSKKAVEEDDDD